MPRARMPEMPSHNQACAYRVEKMAKKLLVSTMDASNMINIVPTTSLKRFMLATLISLPAIVKGKTQIAQQTVPARATNIPTDVMSF